MNQKGQTIIILILIMTVSLAIGLSIVQKSLVDVSTSTKVEETSRAFSAAEAGIEKALNGDTNAQFFADSGSQISNISDTGDIPCIPGVGSCPSGSQAALEYPPLSKEEVTQVWLGDLNSSITPTTPPANYYTQPTLDVYWGNSSTDKAAIELTLLYWDGGQYTTKKWYLDHSSASRSQPNGFDTVFCPGGANEKIGENQYQCYKRLDTLPATGMMLLRARLLYNTNSQPFAVKATGSGAACASGAASGCFLPPQARKIISTGVSGDTQRRIQLFQLNKVVPPYFDYSIFSVGEISK